MLPGGAAQDLLVDQVGDAAEVAVRVARLELDPFGHAAGDAVDGLVRQVFRAVAPPPFEEADEFVANDLVALARLLAVGAELGEQGLEPFAREPLGPGRSGGCAGAGLTGPRHLHSPWREKPAQ